MSYFFAIERPRQGLFLCGLAALALLAGGLIGVVLVRRRRA